MARSMVAATLAPLESHLEPGWPDLLEREEYVALQSRLARARRTFGHVALGHAAGLVERLAARRVDECEAELLRELTDGRLDDARTMFTRLQAMTEASARLDRLAARITEVNRQLRQEGEVLQILAEAQNLAEPPHPPDRLRRAKALYEAVLRRIGDGQCKGLEGRFDLIKDEREHVLHLIESVKSLRSRLETSLAMGRIDDLLQLEADLERDLKHEHNLDTEYALTRLGETRDKIREMLDEIIEGHLGEVAEYMAHPRNAEIALSRLEERRARWDRLSPDLRSRAQQRYDQLTALVEQRREVLERCQEAQALIESGRPAIAIERLSLLSQLYGKLELGVEGDIELAASILVRRANRAADNVESELDDPGLDDADLGGVLRKAREFAGELEPLAGLLPQLEPVIERLGQLNRQARLLRKAFVQTREQIEDVKRLIDQGRHREARTLLQSFADDAPIQRHDEIVRLKRRLDIDIAAHEVVSELRRLQVVDRVQAVEWARSHGDIVECRAFLAQDRFEAGSRDIDRLEREGDYRGALSRGHEILQESPDDLQAFASREVERLTGIEADAPRVREVIESARKAETEEKLEQVWSLFDDDLRVGAHDRGEWHRLRAAAIEAASTSITEKLQEAQHVITHALERWMAESGLDEEPLYTSYGPDNHRRSAARHHLDTALAAVESVRLDLEFLNARRETMPRGLIHLVDQVSTASTLALVEECLERGDFGRALALLPAGSSAPRFLRCRARVQRLQFSRHVVRALQGADSDVVDRLIAEYPVQDGAEVVRARELARSVRQALKTLSTVEDDSADVLDTLRRAIKELAVVEDGRASSAGVLAPVRHQLERALVDEVNRRFARLESDRLPGAVFLQYDLLYRLLVLDGLRVRALLDLQRVVAGQLIADASALFESIEALDVDSAHLSPDRIDSLRERLAILRTAMFGSGEPDERYQAAAERIQRAWGKANEQEDARKRRDALVDEAKAKLDLARLKEAARLEGEGQVGDSEARELVPLWTEAERICDEISNALLTRSFDVVEARLAALENLGVPHAHQIRFPNPFAPGQFLGPGTGGVRAVLADLRRAEQQRRQERSLAIKKSEACIDELWLEIGQIASRCPMSDGGIGSATQDYIQSQAPAIAKQAGNLRASVEGLLVDGSGSERTLDTLDGLLERLPPSDVTGAQQVLRSKCQQFIEDFSYLVGHTQSSSVEVVKVRSRLESIGRRWPGIDAVERLLTSFRRAWHP